MLLAVVAATSCAARGHALPPGALATCRSGGPLLQWVTPVDAATRTRLDAWCAAVGAPLIDLAKPAVVDAVPLEDVVFVSWNTHVGRGDVGHFVNDLRNGAFTNGRPVSHFVLMLQEAMRMLDVPPALPKGARAARRIESGDLPSPIDVLSRVEDAAILYVPSMRNGGVTKDAARPSDRGNALLSTLPLRNATAIELPGRRQRRVAVEAVVGVAVNGALTSVSVSSAHLNVLGSARTFWIFNAAETRRAQARALVQSMRPGTAVLGVDVNSWQGNSEEAIRALGMAFPANAPTRGTTFRGGLSLDRLFFRLPAGWTAEVHRAGSRYGSDHYPLVGWAVRNY